MNPDLERFVELMGRHWEEEGAPRIAGRLLGALMLNAKPCNLDELTEQLQVSKGSISSNARLLETWGVAEKVTVPGDRRDFYQLADNFHERVLEQQIQRNRLLLERLQVGAGGVHGGAPEVRQRFEWVTSYVEATLAALEQRLEQAQQVRL